MESKKTFGEYIRERRKKLGLTQREFAEKLYVTESAASKWERGMSYPDITLLPDICAVLDVTEHELLAASVDTQKRSAERLAEKYQRLTRNFCVFMCIIFGGVLLGFGIAAIANHDLWLLPVAAASVMIAASLTVLPFLRQLPLPEGIRRHKALAYFSANTALLFVLLAVTTGRWFFPMSEPIALAGLGVLAVGFAAAGFIRIHKGAIDQ